MGKTIIILILASVLVLAGILFLIFLNQNFTGKAIETQDKQIYSYTKAICNETNYCQDYEIICEDKEVIDTKPITGAAVQHPENWKDPRDKEIINRVCG